MPSYKGPISIEIANDGSYALYRSPDGFYRAGCRGPWKAERALEHWDGRRDRRATMFAEAIRRAEAESAASLAAE